MFDPVRYQRSWATNSPWFLPPAPPGRRYLPFQLAGIEYAIGLQYCLIGDEPGLGKTIQAIGVANYYRFDKFLVVCPAMLRENWYRELGKWHINQKSPAEIITTGKQKMPADRVVICSYELLPADIAADYVIVDESHYIKNGDSARTRKILGFGEKQGIAQRAKKAVLLSGTPAPNRSHELFYMLYRLAPHVIDNMNYMQFINHYTRYRLDEYGEFRFFGGKNSGELSRRLRSGFMVRRLKSDVLKDLPAKSYKLVVFPADKESRKVMESEKKFSAAEILRHGAPVNSDIGSIRRAMGIAKTPACVRYIKDINAEKSIIFAYHLDVIALIAAGLDEYRPAIITGEQSAIKKQCEIDRFQTDLYCRAIICNYRISQGFNLTAGHNVFFVESSWTPGEDAQAIDRAHRIGQTRGVIVHYLAIEKSIDAVIMAAAVRKQDEIKNVLDGGLYAA